MEVDVLVIGGGPAGLAAAIAAAQAGFTVEVAEPQTGLIDKCCGEGLLPAALAALGELGIGVTQIGEAGCAFAGIEFAFEGMRTKARFEAKAIGMRRTALHALLRRRANAAGVRVVEAGAKLAADGRVRLSNGEERAPRWVVGADGAQSAVRAAAGLEAGSVRSRRFAVRQHFRLAPENALPGFVEVHWGRRMQAYVTPIAPDRVGIAVVSDSELSGIEHSLGLFPSLRGLLEGAEACSRPRGAVTLDRKLRAVQRGNVALVGDASGSVDAITGDGLALALMQALALGRALRQGNLSGYTRAHKRLMRMPRLMSWTLLRMGARPASTRACMGLLRHVPGLFSGLLKMYAYAPRPARVPKQGEELWLPVPTSIRSTR